MGEILVQVIGWSWEYYIIGSTACLIKIFLDYRKELIKTCQTFHQLEILSEIFTNILLNEEKRNKILQLESMKILVNGLVMGQ